MQPSVRHHFLLDSMSVSIHRTPRIGAKCVLASPSEPDMMEDDKPKEECGVFGCVGDLQTFATVSLPLRCFWGNLRSSRSGRCTAIRFCGAEEYQVFLRASNATRASPRIENAPPFASSPSLSAAPLGICLTLLYVDLNLRDSQHLHTRPSGSSNYLLRPFRPATPRSGRCGLGYVRRIQLSRASRNWSCVPSTYLRGCEEAWTRFEISCSSAPLLAFKLVLSHSFR